MIKRIALFLLTNILIIFTITLVLQILGVGNYLSAAGIDYQALLVFCLVWGMTGSVISLMLSRVMAKWMMGVQIIDPKNPGQFGPLVEIVSHLSRAAQLPLPEIGIYDSPEVNAFATGPSKNRALVAVSSGLLRQMDREAITGVIGHELAHIKNGDMVTMTLLQGVINAFVMFLARVLTFWIRQSGRDEENRGGLGDFMLISLFQMVFGLLGSIVVCWFSRQREFRADAGAAAIAGKEKMIAALQSLQRTLGINEEVGAGPESLRAFKISDTPSRLGMLFASHPPLEERIARLQQFRRHA